MSMNTSRKLECRLCKGALSRKFTLTLLGKHDVQYFECNSCGSLQTELPYWLDEAYADRNLSNLDTGAGLRNIHNLAACYAVAKLFKLRNAVDVGGGDGLLCRLLRDHEINCFVKDKYATATYAQGFTEQNFDMPDLLIGFELLEHFPNPQLDLEELFGLRSRVLLLSTEIYANQDSDWWYLAPESGQHVFFYSKKALERVAEKYGYSVLFTGGFTVFLKDASRAKTMLARVLLSRFVCRLLRGIVVVLPARGVWKDHAAQVKKSQQAQQ